MYEHLKFNISPKSVWVIGDIHGQFGLLKFKIKDNQLKDSIIIIAGDCGFGFEKPQYYTDVYNSMKKYLIENNVTVLFVRGNHDDPSYFNEKIIDFPYWKTLKDYSVVTLTDGVGEHNILCIGGAISIDRIDRKRINFQNESKYGNNKKVYWSNEPPVYKPEIIDKMAEDGILINSVVTHTSPKFAPLLNKNHIQGYLLIDEDLDHSLNYERETLSNIYYHLIKNNKNSLKLWCYGHFHEHGIYTSNEGVEFKMLDRVRTNNNSWDSYPIEY